MAGLRVVHEFENGFVIADEYHAEGLGRVERSEQDFSAFEFPVEIVNPEGDMRHVPQGPRYRAVRFKPQIFDALRMVERVRHPYFGLRYVHPTRVMRATLVNFSLSPFNW